ncbi:MAG: DinB family protein [Mucilaginibacter sp.]
MKTVFDETTRQELVDRVNTIKENSVAQWGSMTAGQMLKHCWQWDEMAQGKKVYKQSFIGKLFGKMALKDILKDEPLKRNLPTVPSFKITGEYAVADEKSRWIKLLGDYAQLSNDGFMHPFFGFLTKEQTGYLVYKHADHHLRQFNC